MKGKERENGEMTEGGGGHISTGLQQHLVPQGTLAYIR